MSKTQFAKNVYAFQMEVFELLLTKFDGKVVGSGDCNLGSLKEEFFHGYHPILKATSESNGHGKAWERDIATRVYGIPLEIINGYPHTSKYDILAKDNVLDNKNVSIKASGCMNLCMSDIREMLKSENMNVVCVIWKQINPTTKEATKTIVFDFDDFKDTLITDLAKCGHTLEEWFKRIDEYVKYVKSLPKSYYPNSKKIPQKQREHLIKKAELCENLNLNYFQVNPKIDSDQQRVQCSINLKNINIKKEIFEGGVLFDKTYTKVMVSSKRNRKNK